MNEEEIIGTEMFSGGDKDRLSPRIKKADRDRLAEMDDKLDVLATSPVRPATWSSKRIKGIRLQIQDRYKELFQKENKNK